MSWTQVHVSGLPQTAEPDDEEIEQMLEQRYSLSSSCDWAGEGTTVVKRQDEKCRGYCFLSFLTLAGATTAMDRVNVTDGFPLKAELSKPKGNSKKEKKVDGGDTRDLRLKRMRGQPVRKHPVLTSSDQSKFARAGAIHKARGPG